MRPLILALAVLVTTATVAAATPAEELDAARELFKSGKHAEAIPKLNYLLYPSPRLAQTIDLVEAHILYGVCLFETGDKKEATKELEAALYIDGNQQLDENLFSPEARRFFEETKAAKAARDRAAAEAKALAEKQQALADYIKNLRVVETRQWWVNFMPFGAGQFQNGQRGKGIFFAATEAAAAGTSIGIFFYLTNKYGYGGQVPKEEAADVRLLQQVAIGADVVFYGILVWGIVDAYVHYKPRVEVDKSSLPADLLPPSQKTKPKREESTRLLLHPISVPDGVGLGLTWEN